MGLGQGMQTAAVATLTDSSAGTAGAAVPAITDPADAPATADILRDDLVANAIPDIRDGLASLAAVQASIQAALRSAGIIIG